MLSNEDFQVFVENITGSELVAKQSWLKVLWGNPSRDPRVLPYLEGLLNDTASCLIMIPYTFGEIRWLAAHALSAERAALNIQEPIEMRDIPKPLSSEELWETIKQHDLSCRGGVEGSLQDYEELAARGLLPTYDLHLDPKLSK